MDPQYSAELWNLIRVIQTQQRSDNELLSKLLERVNNNTTTLEQSVRTLEVVYGHTKHNQTIVEDIKYTSRLVDLIVEYMRPLNDALERLANGTILRSHRDAKKARLRARLAAKESELHEDGEIRPPRVRPRL